MKYAVLFFAVLLMQTLAEAQTNKGNVLLGTSTTITGSTTSILAGPSNALGFSFISTKSKDDNGESDPEKHFSFNISPRVGYFLTDRFVLGLTSEVNYLNYEDLADAVVSFNVGPFARHYFDLEKFKPYVQASVAFGQIKFASDWKTSTTDYGGAVGMAFFVGEMVSLDIYGAYNRTVSKDPDANDGSKQIASAFGFGLGVSVFL